MSRRAIVLVISILTALGFAAAAFFYDRYSASEETTPVAPSSLVRFHSPVIGAANAPVTIVEFFDPSCEACRAFFPVVKQILAENPKNVRLVLRYVLFHEGSETAARILETARKQGIYEPVLEAVMAAQPQWHSDPQVQKAWEAAEAAGLDVEKARAEMMAADITETLKTDSQDARAAAVRQTPTFFVNGKPLLSIGAQQLNDLVKAQVEQSK
jgi:protein-disulfide isomerase